MSTERPWISVSEHDPPIAREDAETKEQGNKKVGEQKKGSGEQEMEAQGREGEQGQEEVQVTAPPISANTAIAPTLSGGKRSNPTVKKEHDSYDYEEKYPEDAPYAEAAPTARVWSTYVDESKIHDANMVEEARDSVDVLLVFAGLFSAVVTAFVVQTSQNLQADYAAISASLLYESVLIQRAIANGSSVSAVASSTMDPSTTFVPATIDVWVNGLWFTSLFLSLTTALIAVLVKQWLHHYVALPSGTPRNRSFTRQFRYSGIQKWHVQVIIGLLPALMHLALAIFFVGLAVFLHPLREILSWVICGGTIMVYGAYMVAAVLPILCPQCPYRTPLCGLIYVAFRYVVPEVSWSLWRRDAFVDALSRLSASEMFRYLPRVRTRNMKSLEMIESESVQQMSTELAAKALNWLFSVSSNPTVQSIVIQTIGGLPLASEREFFKLKSYADRKAMEDMQRALLRSCLQPDKENPQYDRPIPGMELKVGRLLRFDAHFNDAFTLDRYIVVPDSESIELMATIKSSYRGHDRPVGFSTQAAFFKDLICTKSSLTLPLPRWSYLVGCAERGGVFSPLNPENNDPMDSFPVDLCSSLLNSFGKSMKHPIQDFSSPVVFGFKDAVPYIHEAIYDSTLHMLYGFILHPFLRQLYASLSKPMKILVVVVEFLLYRLTLFGSDPSHTNICDLLITAVKQINNETFSFQEATAVITVLEGVLPTCFIQEQVPPHTEITRNELCYNTILAYQHSTTISPSACSPDGLRMMVDVVTATWERESDYQWYHYDIPCRIWAHLLANHIPAAYDVFLDKQCLGIFGNNHYYAASVRVIKEYVAAISALHEAMFQQHIEYLHETRNLFIACSILATQGFEDTNRAVIHGDITALVQLCPRAAAWDDCRRKLHDLINNDSDFFNRQRRFDHELRPLQTDEIQVGKNNIGYAIYVLDDFFNNGAYVSAPLNSPTTNRLHRSFFTLSRAAHRPLDTRK